jgi:DNA-binding MarR family transcriptional regulator
MDDDMHRLSNELVVLVARLVRDVRRRNVDLPAASTRLMSLLDELGPSTVGALATADRCSQPTMTGLVNGLVDRGWAERSPHPDDSRANLVTLTALGRTTLATLRRHNADLIAERIAASGRSVDDLETAVALLRDLVPPTQEGTT